MVYLEVVLIFMGMDEKCGRGFSLEHMLLLFYHLLSLSKMVMLRHCPQISVVCPANKISEMILQHGGGDSFLRVHSPVHSL